MGMNRRDFTLAVASSMIALSASGALAAPAKEGKSDAAFTAFLDAAFEEELLMSPEELTSLGRKEKQDELSDPSDKAALARLDWRRKKTAEMKKKFKRTDLGTAAQVSYDMWLLELERAEEG